MKFKMKSFYYYVPPCPNCGSRITGRYVREPRNKENMLYTARESLAHGELIRFLPFVPRTNAYCEECGFEWPQRVDAKWISKERIAEEKRVRGTNRRYTEFMEQNPKKKPSIFHKILGFLP